MSLTLPITFANLSGSVSLSLLDQSFSYLSTNIDVTNAQLADTVTLLNTTISGLNLSSISGTISPSQLSTGHPTWDTSGNFGIGTTSPSSYGKFAVIGSAGQLFTVTDSLSGTLFSVNDVSGIPSIEVLDTGAVKLAQYSGTVGIGTASPSGAYKLDITGSTRLNGTLVVGSTAGAQGQVLMSMGSSAAPVWTYPAPHGIAVFTPTIVTASANAGALTIGSVSQGTVQTSQSFTIAGTAGTITASQSGTTMTVSSAGSATIFPGAVISYGLSATATFGNQASPTRDGTTMNVTAVSSGAVQAGKIINTAAAYTASRATTVMSVTAVSAGGIHVGMVTSNMGTVNAYLTNTTSASAGTSGTSQITLTTVTANHVFGVGQVLTTTAAIQAGTYITSLASGTGGSGTVINISLPLLAAVSGVVTSTSNGGVGRYTMSATGTVASAAATATGTQTISSATSGTGGTGTYVTSSTFFTPQPMTITANTIATVTVTALGTGTGGTGNYTVGTSLTAASGSSTISGGTSPSTSITAGSGSSWTISPTLTFPSTTINITNAAWTVPSNVTAVKVYVAGGGAGGGGGSSGWASANNGYPGNSGGRGGYGGRSIGVLTGLTPGATYNIGVSVKGLGGSGSPSPGNAANTAGNNGTSASGNSYFGSIVATPGTFGYGGPASTFVTASPNYTPGTNGTDGTGTGGTFNATGNPTPNLILYMSNQAGNGGALGVYGLGGGTNGSSKGPQYTYAGTAGGDGVDGFVVVEY